jgi:hypothetical protein
MYHCEPFKAMSLFDPRAVCMVFVVDKVCVCVCAQCLLCVGSA